MIFRASTTTAAILGCVLALGGCGSAPTMQYYVLTEAPGVAADPADVTVEGLGVELFDVAAPYNTDRLVYRVEHGSAAGEDLRVYFYNHHRWAADPGELVAMGLVEALRRLPGLQSAELVRPGASYGHRLRGRVLEVAEVDRTDGVHGRVALDLELVDGGGDVLWRRQVVAEAGDGPASDVGDVVMRIRSALDRAAIEVAKLLE